MEKNRIFSPEGIKRNDKCLVIACYDPRIDGSVAAFARQIRMQHGLLEAKDIQRPPGGAYLTAGDPECRDAFYHMIGAFHQIAKIRHFFYLPHTDCVFCHANHHLKKKIQENPSDLQFHVDAAEKLLRGSRYHFKGVEEASRPSFATGIVITNTQEIITLDYARKLLLRTRSEHELSLPFRSDGIPLEGMPA